MRLTFNGNLKINLSKFLVYTLLFTIFFQELWNAFFSTEIFNYFDELFIVIIGFIIAINSLLTGKLSSFILYCGIVFCYIVVISILFGEQQSIFKIILQSLINLKFFIYLSFFLVLQKNNLIDIKRLVKILFIFCLLGLFLELIFFNKFYEFLNIDLYLRPYAKKGKVVYGGFIKTNVLCFLGVMLYILHSFLSRSISNKSLLFWGLITLVFCILVNSRSPIILLLVFAIIKFRRKLLKPKILFGVGCFLLFALTVIYTNSNFIERTAYNISLMFTKDSYYIRGIMYFLSGEIFIDYFPIGSGSATFGTVLSENSPVYEYYNVAHRSFFLNMDGVYDSNLASIAGEYGFIGLILFSLFFVFLYKPRNKVEDYKTLFITLIFITFFYCFIAPVFMNSYFSLILAFGFAALYHPIFNRNETIIT